MTIAPENPSTAAQQPLTTDPVPLAHQIATMSPEVLHAEFIAASLRAAAILTEIGGLSPHGCRRPEQPIEALIETHVLHLRDAVARQAGKVREDNGSGLLSRFASSAGHAAEDLADTARWYR